MYAGEHAAGTEFMIGPLFLAAGASLQDLIVGLLLGNILAVLTWRFLVVPIAMAKRMTLYYQLERIAGGSLVKFYNVVNGILFCFLAGAMVTVSASAVGVPLGINYSVPESTFGLGSVEFTIIVVLVGLVMAVIAAAGYKIVAQVANIAAPWMIAIFAACGIISLVQMDANSMAALSEGAYWQAAIDFVQAEEFDKAKATALADGVDISDESLRAKLDAGRMGFWQIVVFAWLCNGAMHFGMADLSIFRFARSKASGWAPAIGMFLGHYMAWIAAGLLLAAQIKLSQNSSADPGALAWGALGWTGIICVVIAGWTTANPTIYRAGLAFQGVFPKSPRVLMTLIAGAVATIAGAFPNLSAQLLGFVGTYGTVLGPMGAIIFVDYYFMKRFGLRDEYALKRGSAFNVAVLIAWLLPVAVGLYLIMVPTPMFPDTLFAAYAVIPCWIASGVIYLLLSKVLQSKETAAA
jgi:NCS1 family nucleobase:cation symporter-1